MYKDRRPMDLVPEAPRHFAALITARSVAEAEEALENLGVYDSSSHTFRSWRSAAKLLDDWRCVVSGSFVESLWRLHNIDVSSASTKHGLWLCWGCHIASLWGPCEHAYCCIEHEGQSNSCALPKARAKGRPRSQPQAAAYPSQVAPGLTLATELSEPPPAPSSKASSARSETNMAENKDLRSLLRSVGLGHLYLPMHHQGVTVPALSHFSFSYFFHLFKMNVAESHTLMAALRKVVTLASCISMPFGFAVAHCIVLGTAATIRSANLKPST